MTRRERLPNRRYSETTKFYYRDNAYHLTIGFYPDYRVSEVFVNAGKVGTDIATLARDGAVLISLALQHGVPIETMVDGVTRDQNNEPSTVIGAMLEQLKQESKS